MRSRLLTVLPTVLLLMVVLPASDARPSPADTVVETVVDEVHGLPEPDGAAPRAPNPATSEPATSEPIRTPIEFSMLAFTGPRGATISYRTSADRRTWTAWASAEGPEGVGPDAGTVEARRAAGHHRRSGEPMWVGEASYLQVTVDGAALDDIDVDLIDSMGLSRSLWQRATDALRSPWRGGDVVTAQAAGQPPIVTRAGWGADESMRKGAPAYASQARYGVLHHTAGTNTYTAAQAPGIVRGIYAYHTRSRGWSDIGYNFLVDRFGTIYEGRHGGMTRAVIGAHALGFNTGSIGVSMLGNHDDAAVSTATRTAVTELLAWKFGMHGINPAASVSVVSACSGGSCKRPGGTTVRLPTLFGHRDVGYTSCPGASGYATLPGLRTAIAASITAPVSYTPPFSDDDASPHAAGINNLHRWGITKGCTATRFCPKLSVSRGQMASLLGRALVHLQMPQPQPVRDWFDDDNGSVHEQAINALAETQVSRGCTDGSFCPTEPILRGDVAEWIANAFGLQPQGTDHFTDDDTTSYEWAINALADARLTTGCASQRYCPGKVTSRGQMASFLSRTITKVRAGL
jgi:hypothetical protein